MSTVLDARGLRKDYEVGGTRVDAVRGVDLHIAGGEMVAIMGPSGSGKSTLLSLLGAIEVPSGGQVLLEGQDIADLDDDQRTLLRRRRIGFVFQAFNLLPTLTALENVAIPLELDGVSARVARQRAQAALERVGMTHRQNHLPRMLSGGEQQRVAIARAVVIEPVLMLADEPTGNLDSASGGRITAILEELVEARHETVLLVTHDPMVASKAHRIIRLRDGRVETCTGQVE